MTGADRQVRPASLEHGASQDAPRGRTGMEFPPFRILLLDERHAFRRALVAALESESHQVMVASRAQDGLAAAARSFFDLLLVEAPGTGFFRKFLALSPWTKVVALADSNGWQAAAEAIRQGASDCLFRPFTETQVGTVTRKISRLRRMDEGWRSLRGGEFEAGPEPGLSSSNLKMQRALSMARLAASSEEGVLLVGEPGTGKRTLARAIHSWSRRAAGPFAAISCSTRPAGLVEGELFGFREKPWGRGEDADGGRLASCRGGTLLLADAGEVSPGTQARLLEFLEARERAGLGGPGGAAPEARIFASTSLDLGAAARGGWFLEDLLYRLNVVQIEVPSLRERREDILPLARSFLDHAAGLCRRPGMAFSPRAEAGLVAYDWPGNIRELRDAVERAVLFSPGQSVEPEYLPSRSALPSAAVLPQAGDPISLQNLEEAHLRLHLSRAKSMEETASVLGIDVTTLWRKRKKLNL